MSRGTQFSDKYRFKWVQTPGEINYMKFQEGRHIVNHISNAKMFTFKIPCMEMLADLNRSLQCGDIQSEIYQNTSEFLPVTYRLDSVADFVQFLNCDNDTLWLVKKSISNMGRGIEMVNNVAAFKEQLINSKDKWGEQIIKPEEVKQVETATQEPSAEEEKKEEAVVAPKKVVERAPVYGNNRGMINLVKNFEGMMA